MKFHRILSIIGAIIVIVALFLPWVSISLTDYGSMQPSLFDFIIGRYSAVFGPSFLNMIYASTVMAIVAFILGLISFIKKIVAGGAVACVALNIILSFIALFIFKGSIPEQATFFSITYNVGPIVMIIAGIIFAAIVTTTTNQATTNPAIATENKQQTAAPSS